MHETNNYTKTNRLRSAVKTKANLDCLILCLIEVMVVYI